MSDVFPIAQLCGCLMRCPLEELPALLSHAEVDMVEWRLDAFSETHGVKNTIKGLAALSSRDRRPVVATSRLKRDGGVFAGSEPERLDLLKRAVLAGAEWIDLEDDLDMELYRYFQSSGAGLIVSYHDCSGTPSASYLHRKMEQMSGTGAKVIKIATFATSPEDNLTVLELIPFGKRELEKDVVAFCMGRKGRWSRAACLILGSPWSYVPLPGQTPAAPGQMTPSEMRSLMELLG